ncbi:hypothetical protein BC936DRAFT_137823 [Jimgerdemannia flammicorona]|uniref:Uncharacterized protein n=1 Tax=Jimgerdemannia flammicorona TaxID=994334 RepID=A0A433CWL0_9FUNG|nr:hypothetical protein BC936DRAFT_137823 [Jimgerdemannia flammicorona]
MPNYFKAPKVSKPQQACEERKAKISPYERPRDKRGRFVSGKPPTRDNIIQTPAIVEGEHCGESCETSNTVETEAQSPVIVEAEPGGKITEEQLRQEIVKRMSDTRPFCDTGAPFALWLERLMGRTQVGPVQRTDRRRDHICSDSVLVTGPIMRKRDLEEDEEDDRNQAVPDGLTGYAGPSCPKKARTGETTSMSSNVGNRAISPPMPATNQREAATAAAPPPLSSILKISRPATVRAVSVTPPPHPPPPPPTEEQKAEQDDFRNIEVIDQAFPPKVLRCLFGDLRKAGQAVKMAGAPMMNATSPYSTAYAAYKIAFVRPPMPVIGVTDDGIFWMCHVF